MYAISLTKFAEKQLYKLPDQIQKRIIASIERCRIRPYAHAKKLLDNPYFRLRVGDYRIIVDIQDNKLHILVIEIGNRKNIYKK
jgi:mRNA interferase RelE/StbE